MAQVACGDHDTSAGAATNGRSRDFPSVRTRRQRGGTTGNEGEGSARHLRVRAMEARPGRCTVSSWEGGGGPPAIRPCRTLPPRAGVALPTCADSSDLGDSRGLATKNPLPTERIRATFTEQCVGITANQMYPIGLTEGAPFNVGHT